jgi:4-amino-4-deoxyprephenate dehydrogenase
VSTGCAPVLRRAVIAGGAGAVGALFSRELAASGVDVCVVDRVEPDAGGHRFVAADVTRPGPALAAEVHDADLVLLAVPEAAALAAVAPLAGAMRPGAVLADTLSVKSRIADAMQVLPAGVEAVSLNPMFAPALGFSGRPVAAVVIRKGRGASALLGLVGAWGGGVVAVTADEHDRLAAAGQALTHAAVLAFGLALTELQVDAARLRQIAPPPHTTMLAMLARIAAGTPEVYWDVQAGNPYAAQARTALARGVSRFAQLADRDEDGFAAALAEIAAAFGPELGDYRNICAHVFATINEKG